MTQLLLPNTRFGAMASRFSRRAVLAGAAGLGLAQFGGRRAAAQHSFSSIAPIPGTWYDAYIPTASKSGQFFHYTCEFDAAWAVLATFGVEAPFEDQLALVGHDLSIEPWYEETASGFVIYGGEIGSMYSGDYTHNILARTTGAAMRPMFEWYGMQVTPVHDRLAIESALRGGALVWLKATADFYDGVPTTWITPSGLTYPTVLGNDHAVVAMGYNADVVVIRDVLGPTDTNWERQLEYELPWENFLYTFAQQGNDGLAVKPAPVG